MNLPIYPMDKIYSDAPIWKAKYIPFGIKWWEKILLWFKPAHYSCDDHKIVKVKWLFGKLYVLDFKDVGSKRRFK